MSLEKLTEKYLADNTETVEKLTKSIEPVFKEVNAIKAELIKIDSNNMLVIRNALLKLTGYYMTLEQLRVKIESLKRNKELAYYYNCKFKAEQAGEKFVDGSTSKESEFASADERRLRNILEGFCNSCLEGIRTCRTLINVKEREATGE